MKLLEAGADVSVSVGDAGGALLWAVSDPANLEIVTMLLEAGADVNARPYSTALIEALRPNPYYGRISDPNPEIIAVLLKYGANVNARDANNMTALRMAINSNTLEVIAMLLKAGADANAGCVWSGMTPLMEAALRASPEVIIAMLEAGADANARDNDGRMAIDYARYNPNLANTDAFRRLEAASR